MKKLLWLMLVGLFLFSQWGIALAAQEGSQVREGQGQLNMEQALKIAGKVLDLPPNLKSYNVNYQSANQWLGNPRWDFHWYDAQPGSYENYSVSIDAETGDVLHLNSGFRMPQAQQKSGAKLLSKEASRQKAEAFVKKMVGEKFGELKAVPDSTEVYYKSLYGGTGMYDFRWQRLIKGIPFEDQVMATVDANTGKVINYSFQWTRNMNFPGKENIISLEAARKIFSEGIGLGLYYQGKESPFPGWMLPVRLLYLPVGTDGGGFVIDGVNGKLLNRWTGQELEKAKLEFNPLSSEGGQQVPPVGKKAAIQPLSMEEALNLAEKTFDIPKELKLQDRRYNESWQRGGSRTWSFTWGYEDYQPGTNVTIQVDIDSGEIRSYNKFEQAKGNTSQGLSKISREEAQKIAENFLKKLFPEKVNSLAATQNLYGELNPEEEFNVPFSFDYIRMANGIPYNGNNLNIQINRLTGQIENLWMMWDDRVLPDSKGAISATQALEKFWTTEKLELQYLRLRTKTGSPGEIRLAYVLKQDVPKGINALTGEVESIYGFPQKPESFKDLAGHWVSDQAIALASIGIVHENAEEFAPERTVTRAEFLKMLVNIAQIKLVSPETPSFRDVAKDKWYYPYVETGIKERLVKGEGQEFRPDAPVTRQEMAVILDRLIPEARKGETGPFLESFKDSKSIAPWAREGIRRLVSLGIIRGADGEFAPTKPASRAEAVSLLYSFLQAQETPGFRTKGGGIATGGGMAAGSTGNALNTIVTKGELAIMN